MVHADVTGATTDITAAVANKALNVH